MSWARQWVDDRLRRTAAPAQRLAVGEPGLAAPPSSHPATGAIAELTNRSRSNLASCPICAATAASPTVRRKARALRGRPISIAAAPAPRPARLPGAGGRRRRRERPALLTRPILLSSDARDPRLQVRRHRRSAADGMTRPRLDVCASPTFARRHGRRVAQGRRAAGPGRRAARRMVAPSGLEIQRVWCRGASWRPSTRTGPTDESTAASLCLKSGTSRCCGGRARRCALNVAIAGVLRAGLQKRSSRGCVRSSRRHRPRDRRRAHAAHRLVDCCIPRGATSSAERVAIHADRTPSSTATGLPRIRRRRAYLDERSRSSQHPSEPAQRGNRRSRLVHAPWRILRSPICAALAEHVSLLSAHERARACGRRWESRPMTYFAREFPASSRMTVAVAGSLDEAIGPALGSAPAHRGDRPPAISTAARRFRRRRTPTCHRERVYALHGREPLRLRCRDRISTPEA